MIERTFAEAQLMRLTGLDFFPLGNEHAKYRAELVKALCGCSLSDAHAGAIVDLCARCLRQAPKPADLYQFAEQTAERFRQRNTNGDCPYCHGTGFSRTWILHTHEGNGHYREEQVSASQYSELREKVQGIGVQHVAEGVVRCQECNYGRRLAVAEQTERQAS